MLKNLEKKRILSLAITIFLAVVIFLFSNLKSYPSNFSFFDFSFLYHFGIFFLFSLFLLITIKGEKETEKHHILLVLGISLIYAGLDEFHQSFVLGRNPSIVDLIADFLGSIVAVGFYEKLKALVNKL